jgi:hypothetical protein
MDGIFIFFLELLENRRDCLDRQVHVEAQARPKRRVLSRRELKLHVRVFHSKRRPFREMLLDLLGACPHHRGHLVVDLRMHQRNLLIRAQLLHLVFFCALHLGFDVLFTPIQHVIQIFTVSSMIPQHAKFEL